MKLIVGLGNPGEKYKNTRHNVGFIVIDELKDRLLMLKSKPTTQYFEKDRKFNSEILVLNDVILSKPQTFMNDSGRAVKSLSTYYHVPSTKIRIVHDDLDIRLGDFKIQKGVGPKLHYGVASIEESLGTPDFWRVRIGVDNREGKNRILGGGS